MAVRFRSSFTIARRVRPAVAAARDGEAPAGSAVHGLAGTGEQVEEHLRQPDPVSPHRRQVGLQGEGELHVGELHLGDKELQTFLQDAVHLQDGEGVVRPAGQLTHLVDDPRRPVNLFRDQAEVSLHFLFAARFVFDHVECVSCVVLNACQGLVQLVRDRGSHLSQLGQTGGMLKLLLLPARQLGELPQLPVRLMEVAAGAIQRTGERQRPEGKDDDPCNRRAQ
jgi:hypothetical protein